ncbi:CHAT domain-containing protein [Nonomuraea sp. MTCD27]|uniref:CHAT domain-containing protein n=1 Tax=Nonomuraea sp. MTCD27 TaxID=1676747 RepID=UPI0035C0AACC
MRLWPVVYAGIALLPVPLAGWAVLRGSPIPAVLLLAPAVTITAMSLGFLVVTRRLSPPQRARTLAAESQGTSLAYLTAFSVLGAWLVDLWDASTWLHPYQFWLALLLAAQELTRVRQLGGPVGVFVRAALDKGLFVYLMGLFHDGERMAVFGALVVGFSVPLQVMGLRLFATPQAMPRRLDAQRFSDGDEDYRGLVLRTWVASALLRRRSPVAVLLYRLVRGPRLRPRTFDHRRFAEGTRQYSYDLRAERLEAWRRLPPDLSLPHTLCHEGRLAVQSSMQSKDLEEIHPTVARAGEAALHWPELAERLLRLARSPVVETTPALERAVDLGDAHVAQARGEIMYALGRKEEALAEFRRSWRLRLAHGLVNVVAGELSTQGMATVTAPMSQLMLPQDALAELRPLLDRPGLVPAMRRMLLIAVASCQEALGEQRLAEETRRAAEAVRPRRRDLVVINREARQAGDLRQSWRLYQRQLVLYEWSDVTTSLRTADPYDIDLGEQHMPPLVLAREYESAQVKALMEAGVKSWMLGGHAEGAGLLRQAADILESEEQPIQAYLLLVDIGLALRRIDARAAYDTLARALDLHQRLRAVTRDSELRLTAGAPAERLVSAMVTLLAEAGARPGEGWPESRGGTVFQLSEIARSRVLLDLLGERAGAPKHGEQAGAGEHGDPMAYAELRELLREEDLATKGPGRAYLAEYFLTPGQAVIMIASAGDAEPELVTVPCPLTSVRELVTELSATLEAAPRDPAALARVSTLLADELLVNLVAPVAERLAPGDRLWLVPHDALHRVPLHAVDPRLAGHPVAYVPSASLLRHCRAGRGGRRKRALVVADPPAAAPLTFGATQAALLARLFATEVLADAQATGARLTTRLRRAAPDILHVGAHGVFDPRAPMRSGVLLADGLFTAERFRTLHLSGILVVLAACRSGVTAARPGDELLGLVRSVLNAGAPALLVSQWTVDELATAMLLGHFYEGLAARRSAVEALSTAQRLLRETTADGVLAYLRSATPQVSGDGRARLRVAEARIRLAARDFPGAAAACTAALETLTDSDVRHTAETLRQRALLLAATGAAPDLTRPVYAHPFFWAAFVLIGDSS